jgi:hypothetical protein
MNCFLHGIEDFQIVRGDTLSEPKFVQGDKLMKFDVVLANPPYSIKQWDRDTFSSDPWGRNLYGTPPQGNADYAFFQHILCSLARKTGRCAILFPHGILFRDAEAEMRRKLIETDLIECVVGLGMNLFYNSSMPSCVVICRSSKPTSRKGKVLLINAFNEVTRERAQSFLTDAHIARIVRIYRAFRDEPGFARVVTLNEFRAEDGNLNIATYVAPAAADTPMRANRTPVVEEMNAWLESSATTVCALNKILPKAKLPRIVRSRATARWPLLRAKDEWGRARLGDLVQKTEITERSALEAGFDRYLMVEHLDAESLRINRWGDLADANVPPTFYKVFRTGQILYPTRNPQLRRAAFAHFDGICGEKTLTLSSCPGVDSRFLAYVFHSNSFVRYATSRRIGSTNPHVRWRDVAGFEFGLPSADQQHRLAELLWDIDDVIECHLGLETASKNAGSRLRSEHFTQVGRSLLPMSKAGRWISGKTPSRSNSEFWSGSFPWVSPKDMKHDLIFDSEEHLSEAGRTASGEVGSGALLVVIRGMILAHSFPVAIAQRSVAFNQDMKALVPAEAFSSQYLFHWFRWATPQILGRISDSSHGTKRLAMEDLFEMKVPMLPLPEQDAFIQRVSALELAESCIRSNVMALKRLRTTLLNQIFGQP